MFIGSFAERDLQLIITRYNRQNAFKAECTGRGRCIGCLKLQVSFCKKANKHRALSEKETSKDKASYASSPPCREFLFEMLYIQL